MKKLGVLVLTLLLASCGGTLAAAPVISAFRASAAAVNSGEAVTLTWGVSNASKVVLQPGAVDVTGRSSYAVTPAVSTVYTLQASGDSSSAQATAPVRVYDWSRLGSVLDGFVSSAVDPPSGSVAGYSFLLFDRSGVLLTRAAGDHSPSTPETLASATKLPSALAILTLVDQGRLNLDTPIASYLQGAGNPITWPGDKAAITMRMLLSHTSGLPGLGDGQPACLNQPSTTTLRSCAQQIASTALVSAPGAEFNYGGADYQVAGYVATLIAGASSWQVFFNNAIAAPLGGIPSYSYGSPLTVSNPRIGGGAVSNVSDYATILRMVQGGGASGGTRVLSASAIAALTGNQIQGLPNVYNPFPADAAGDYPGYGLGVFISTPALYKPSPGPEYSDPGLYGAVPWFDNGLGYGAVLLINQDTSTGLAMWNAARPLIIQQLSGG
ncbi:MAG: serine hydrolase [Nevskia sp.]|nr:serine hydrolase [Nevskia sp.]